MADQDIPLESILATQSGQGVPLATLAQMIRSGQMSGAPVQNFLTAAGHMVAPNLTDYLRNGPSPDTAQTMTPYASGKLPSIDPRATRAVQEVGNLAATAPMAAMGPEVGAAAARVAPELAGRVAGAMPQMSERAIADIAGGAAASPSMSTPAYAGERPTITPEEADQIQKYDAQLSDLNTKRQAAMDAAAAKIKQPLRPRAEWQQAAYKTAMDAYNANVADAKSGAATPFDKQIGDLSTAKKGITDAVLGRGVAFDQQEAAANAAQQPIAVRNAPALMAARAAAIGTSPIVGGLLGYKGFSPLKQITGGMVEGALPNIGANTIDYATGGAAKEQALKNFTDPDWWKYAVGTESGLAGAGALVGGHVGEAIRTPTPRGEPRPNASLPGGQPSGASPLGQAILAGQSTKVWPSRWQDIDMKKDSAGNWYEVGTGHKIPARLYPPSNAKSNPPSSAP